MSLAQQSFAQIRKDAQLQKQVSDKLFPVIRNILDQKARRQSLSRQEKSIVSSSMRRNINKQSLNQFLYEYFVNYIRLDVKKDLSLSGTLFNMIIMAEYLENALPEFIQSNKNIKIIMPVDENDDLQEFVEVNNIGVFLLLKFNRKVYMFIINISYNSFTAIMSVARQVFGRDISKEACLAMTIQAMPVSNYNTFLKYYASVIE